MKPTVVEGPGRIFYGAIEEKGEIVWQCKHKHSKKEYDQRYRKGYSVWESSALNCAKRATLQNNREGFFGKIDTETSPGFRADRKRIIVNDVNYMGSIELNDNGERILLVMQEVDTAFYAYTLIDKKVSDGTYFSSPHPQTKEELATALWHLKSSVWGVIFQDDSDVLPVDIEQEAIDTYLSQKKRTRKKTGLSIPENGEEPAKKVSGGKPAHINISYENENRVFEVIDQDGQVTFKTPHRGLAFKKLDKLKGAS